MNNSRFKVAGAHDKFNAEQVKRILQDLAKHDAKTVAMLWDCSLALIYKIKKGEYPYNYILGTEAYMLANKKKIRNQDIVLKRIAAGERKSKIVSDLKMSFLTVSKIFKIWENMTEDEKKSYYPDQVDAVDTVDTADTVDTKTILTEDEIESLGNIMDEVRDEMEEEIEDTEVFAMDRIETQVIEFKLNGFNIIKVYKFKNYQKGGYIFIKEDEEQELQEIQEIPKVLAKELIKGVPGTPVIVFKETVFENI